MEGRVAVITGAGSGIGRAVAMELGALGYRLVLAGRRIEALEETSAAIGGVTLLCPTDVTDAKSVDATFSQAVDRFGRVDMLFNNAGVSPPPAPIDEVRDEDWHRLIDTNLTGMFFCLRAAFRTMKAQDPRGGRIINNGSIAASSPRPHSVAYAASKHGVSGLTKAMSIEGRAFDVACGQIDIGNAASAMAKPQAAGVLQANGTIMAEPTMDLAHVAKSVAYMDSLPLEANVQFLTVMATKMPYIGRG